MGLFKKRTDPEEIERLRGEIAAMSQRLAANESAEQQLATRVTGITDRLDAPSPPPPDPPPPMPTIDPAEIDMINAKIARLADRVDVDAADGGGEPAVTAGDVAQIHSRLDEITGRLDAVDQRITSISTELANQITEMNSDLEALGANEPATDEVVDGLRDAQSRLAAEQARYQIAFRQDLAALADRLKRA